MKLFFIATLKIMSLTLDKTFVGQLASTRLCSDFSDQSTSQIKSEDSGSPLVYKGTNILQNLILKLTKAEVVDQLRVIFHLKENSLCVSITEEVYCTLKCPTIIQDISFVFNLKKSFNNINLKKIF